MQFSGDILIRVLIFVLGLCGFAVARHIYKHKDNEKDPLICPAKFDCHGVTHSNYSRFFGMPVEILGIIYYGLVSLFYFLFIFFQGIVPDALSDFMVFISLAAFIFSIYLICVQIFILKKGCSWCFVSAFISVLIFILTRFI